MNYTKGEWKVYDGHDHKLGEILILAPNPVTDKPNYEIAKVFDTWPNHTETTANARLIAAAPELYEALKEIKHLLDTHELPDVVLHQVISGKCFLALKKAEGG